MFPIWTVIRPSLNPTSGPRRAFMPAAHEGILSRRLVAPRQDPFVGAVVILQGYPPTVSSAAPIPPSSTSPSASRHRTQEKERIITDQLVYHSVRGTDASRRVHSSRYGDDDLPHLRVGLEIAMRGDDLPEGKGPVDPRLEGTHASPSRMNGCARTASARGGRQTRRPIV